MSTDVLLDTNVVLRLAADDAAWRARIERLMADPASTLTVSVVSWCEIAIKQSIGKLDVDLGELRAEALTAGMLELPLTGGHAEQLAQLPLHHRDPFDRLLLAQAMSEEMTIATADAAFRAYDVPLLG